MASILTRFSKQIETSDSLPDEQLKTHYYKASFNQVFQTVEKLFHEDADCRVTTVSKEHGEIAVEVQKPFSSFLVVTVVSERPLETSVDFKISTERFSLGGNYPALKKRLVSYYERLNRLHTLIGRGKNR